MEGKLVTYKTITAGLPGTKSLMQKDGMELICVRYRYDKQNHRKIKTAEYIVSHWDEKHATGKIPFNKIMHLRVEYGEEQIGRIIRSSGGTWNKEKKYWELQYREVISLGLSDRIIPENVQI